MFTFKEKFTHVHDELGTLSDICRNDIEYINNDIVDKNNKIWDMPQN